MAVLDWGLGSTLIALGVMPVGVAERRLYADWVRSPAIPDGVAELGLRTEPSFEGLAALKPDLILTNPLNESMRDRLARIAPTFANTTFAEERRPLERCRAMTLALGERLGRASEARALIAESQARLASARASLEDLPRRPLLPINVLDSHHLVFYGKGSLYVDVLDALGFETDLRIPTSIWGSMTGEIADLARFGHADTLVIEPVPRTAQAMMEQSGLWSSLLTATGAKRYRLPPVWAFGDVSTAARFAETLAAMLVDRRAAHAG